ncbi:hypothetical protein COCCADRAFT_99497 [Bipolaris zeicola 26-R-13]|uniref:Uncharacterized protein n=1 Tax=Cochliobolus carbonum (strain 26-R-13) TaxID=930089 RepID=W6YL85_COCC2|nr:uncharacterized protein COCCADRAFT_99497 [Bipolaris zeicola 26-R-13]EUC32141.1 hypothetical protein COCCADRAFT_99497 [Bipolaris zeicola 26-R-13]
MKEKARYRWPHLAYTAHAESPGLASAILQRLNVPTTPSRHPFPSFPHHTLNPKLEKSHSNRLPIYACQCPLSHYTMTNISTWPCGDPIT